MNKQQKMKARKRGSRRSKQVKKERAVKQPNSERERSTGIPRPSKIVALVANYGENDNIQRIEVSITRPRERSIITHRMWDIDGSKDMDQVTDEVMAFCEQYRAVEIKIIDRLLPLSEASDETCPHCDEPSVRVPW